MRCRGRKFDSEGDVVPREKTRPFLFWCFNAFIYTAGFPEAKGAAFFSCIFGDREGEEGKEIDGLFGVSWDDGTDRRCELGRRDRQAGRVFVWCR